MKLYEIINTLNKSPENAVEVFPNDLRQQLNLPHSKPSENASDERLTCFWVYKTGSEEKPTGLKAYFFDGKFVATSTIAEKKHTRETYQWTSFADVTALRNYLITPSTPLDISYCWLDEELDEGYTADNSEVLPEQGTWNNMTVEIVGEMFLGTVAVVDGNGDKHNIPVTDLILPYNVSK